MVRRSAAAAAKDSLFIGQSPCAGQPAYIANQAWRNSGVVVVGADRGAVELVVVDVLQADAGVEPWPAGRLAGAERDVGDLGHPAVAVRGQRASGDRSACRTRSASAVPQILKYWPVRTIRLSAPKANEACSFRVLSSLVGLDEAQRGEARIEPLKLANVAAAQRHPVIGALILILRVEADVGEPVGHAERSPVVPVTKLVSIHGCTSVIMPKVPSMKRVRAPMRLERNAPIGRHAAEQAGRVERIDAERVLLVEARASCSR